MMLFVSTFVRAPHFFGYVKETYTLQHRWHPCSQFPARMRSWALAHFHFSYSAFQGAADELRHRLTLKKQKLQEFFFTPETSPLKPKQLENNTFLGHVLNPAQNHLRATTAKCSLSRTTPTEYPRPKKVQKCNELLAKFQVQISRKNTQ